MKFIVLALVAALAFQPALGLRSLKVCTRACNVFLGAFMLETLGLRHLSAIA